MDNKNFVDDNNVKIWSKKDESTQSISNAHISKKYVALYSSSGQKNSFQQERLEFINKRGMVSFWLSLVPFVEAMSSKNGAVQQYRDTFVPVEC